MSFRLEKIFNSHLSTNRSSCAKYNKDTNSCSASRCVCSAVSEVLSYIDHCLPSKMNKFEFTDFNGVINGEEIISKTNVGLIMSKISKYCFNNEKLDIGSSRNLLNYTSCMDKRFSSGTNLIIHGEEKFSNDGIRKKNGKTLLASMVLKEAIWRRLFKTNRAFTYYYSPMSKIIDDRLTKKELDMTVSPSNCDWLCIDDIYDKGKQIQASILEDVFISRQSKCLPTIYIVKFDASSKADLETVVGESLSRCFSGDKNCIIIDVS